jgi:hypothetical protein
MNADMSAVSRAFRVRIRLPGYTDVAEGANSMRQQGSSLVGVLMIVLVLGGLTAAAVVGVSSLTGGDNSIVTGTTVTGPTASGSPSTTGHKGGIGAEIGIATAAACNASAAVARSVSTSYFATSGGQYPVKWADLTASNAPLFKPAANVTINAGNPAELDGPGWKLTMAGGGTTAPTFTCAT